MRQLPAALWCLACLLAVGAQAGNAAPTPDTLNPEQIAARRKEIEETRARESRRFDAMDAECRTRFAVNDCLRDSQAQRRSVMAPLRSQENRLNDMERAQRAADQIRSTEQKAAERRQRDQEVADAHAAQLAAQAQRRKELEDRRMEHASRPTPQPPKAAKSPSGPGPQQQAANRAALESRRAQAEQRKRELEKRRQEKTGKPASSLPVPP